MNTSTDTRTWIRVGASQGGRWGASLAFAYTVWLACSYLTLFFNLLPRHITAWLTNIPSPVEEQISSIASTLHFIPFAIVIGNIIGGIPALLIGAGTGGALGWFLSHTDIAPYAKSRLIVGVGVGIISVLSVNIMMVAFFAMDGMFLAIPSVVYMGACLGLSHQLPRLVERAHAKESPVNPITLPSS